MVHSDCLHFSNMVSNIDGSHVLNVTNTPGVVGFFSNGNFSQAKVTLLYIKLEDENEVE